MCACMEGGGELHFLLEKQLSSSSRHEKSLLGGLCHALLDTEEERSAQEGTKSGLLLTEWIHSNLKPLNVQVDREEDIELEIIKWRDRFCVLYEILRERKDETSTSHLLGEKWREGVARLISTLRDFNKNFKETFKVLTIGFQLVKCIAEFNQERTCILSSNDAIIDFSLSEILQPFIKKMVEEWLPSLQPEHEAKDLLLEVNCLLLSLKRATVLPQWISILVDYIIVAMVTDKHSSLRNILLTLEKYVEAMMTVVTKSKDVTYWYKTLDVLNIIHESLSDLYYQPIPITDKSSLLRLSEWVWQCSSVMSERIIVYHVEMCCTSLLHNQVTYQGKHISFSVQMWHYYLQCLSNDVQRLVHSQSSSLQIITKVLEKTLKTLTQHYVKTPPSSADGCRQYRADVTAILLTVCTLLPTLRSDREKRNEANGHSTIDHLCLSLLHSLALFASPLAITKTLIERATERRDRRSDDEQGTKWQSCLPLETFGLHFFYAENETKDHLLISLLTSPGNIDHALLLKCLLDSDERLRKSLITINPQLFPSMADIMLYFKPIHLLGLFSECNINIGSHNEINSIAFSWLREKLATPIKNVLIVSAYCYTLTAMRCNEEETLSVTRRLFENLPVLIKDIDVTVLAVLSQLISESDKVSGQQVLNGSQLVFGRLFECIIQFHRDLSPLPLSLVQIFSHWNVFNLIVQQFFPPSSPPSPTSSSESTNTGGAQYGLTAALSVISKLDVSFIKSKIQDFHQLITSSHLSTESLMDSRLSSIAAEAILSSSHGRDSFAVLERHIGLNKERLVNECLDFSVPHFDVIRSCTHLNNKPFVDVFEATVNWEAVLTTDLSSSQSRQVLLRWEMSSDSLNEDDSQLVTEIKKLLAS